MANQQKPAVEPADDAAKAGHDTFTARGCSSCHAINGVSDPKDVPLVAGAAPNLTHLMSRTTFAGATYNLITPDCTATPPGPTGTPKECLNRDDLEAWLRDPNRLVPMAASDGPRHAQPPPHRG